MWSLKRKRATTTTKKVPTEIQDYYEAGRRERKGIAWLLGIVTLIVTLLLALLLFFGGRWLFRKISNKEDAKAPNTVQQTPNSNQTPSGNEGASEPPDTSNSPATGNSTPTGANTPTTGSPEPLPRTGPDLDL